MERTNIYLELRQTRSLDGLARDAGVSRSEIIRRLLDRALDGADQDLSSDLAAINDSFGSIPAAVPVSREPGDREAHLAKLWADD